jgi:hypothetical protein
MEIAVGIVVIVGFLLRLSQAVRFYLNPDELQYFFLSLPSSFKALYLGSRQTHHPPLLFFLLHWVIGFSSSEIAVRMVPLLAGSLFPWVVYRWVARVWNVGAAFAALLILTFSPNLIALGAQARGYTLGLLFAGLAILFLEIALETGSILHLAAFTGWLYLAILSEYSTAWFAGAAGVYFLIRAREPRVSRRTIALWAPGQAGALSLYVLLYETILRSELNNPLRGRLVEGYLHGAFPTPHQNLFVFAVLGTVKQFAYTFSSAWLGVLALVLFAAGLILLWRGLTPGGQVRSRALAVFLVAPFPLALAGAVLLVHPYGRTRQTVLFSLFIALGVGVAVERIFRSRIWIAALCALVLVPLWHFAAEPDQLDIAGYRHRRESMIAAVDYLRSSLPAGTLIMTDMETGYLLHYYLKSDWEKDVHWDIGHPADEHFGPFRVTWVRWDLGSADTFAADLASVREHFGLNPGAPVWIVNGGFDIGVPLQPRDRDAKTLPGFRNFDDAVVVFQTPPGM